RLLAAVADLSAGAIPRLLLVERRDDPERDGYAGRECHLADAGRRFPRHVFEVRRLSADHDTHARDRPIASASGEEPGGLRTPERPGDPVDVHLTGADTGRREGLHSPV